ncbi:MAG: PD-(D/E)XK nuclease family protein [Candidatus Thorarchaeota archaeon]
MKYTNNHKIPDIVRHWLEFDEYDYEEGVISATGLLRPIRATVLAKLNDEEVSIDIADLIAARYGTAIHDSFEKVMIPNTIQEKRMYADVGSYKVSGKPDIMKIVGQGPTYQMVDIKSTSVWTLIYGSRDEDHKIQLSIYRWLAVVNGYTMTDDAEIIYIFTDWSRSKAKNTKDYPQLRIHVKTLNLMTNGETEEYVLERLSQIHYYTEHPDELPECTREELWQGDDKWAVMKEGRKSAVKLHDTEESAFEHLDNVNAGGHSIEHRPGKVNRCNYCNARAFCKQYAKMSEDGIIAD